LLQRQRVLDEVRRQPAVPVLIVGGGINGCGLFRELALQGVRVLLVDKGDFCCGASAAPSRMIHGGLRYLEFGEFRLVREALTDRNLLLQNAPHYVFPLPTTIPIFAWFAGIGSSIRRFLRLRGPRSVRRGALMVKLGLTFYDVFTRKSRLMPRHSFTSRAESLARRPQLHPGIVRTATYYDARITYPERLGLELLLDGEASCPQAQAVNYVSLQTAAGDTVSLRDELSGEVLAVKPQVIVNATGGWIDFTNRALGHETRMIGGTKGAHLVLDHPALYETLQGEMIYFETADGRVAIALPWLGRALIGSTDVRCGNPDDVRVTEEEIDYILESIRQVLPDIAIDRSHILSYFTGVRPMKASADATTVEVSRDHECAVLEPTADLRIPVYSMIGGKWTTFRAFSEQVTDRLLQRLGQSRRVGTEQLAIGGGKDYPQDEAARQRWLIRLQGSTGLSRDRLTELLTRYGTRAEAIAQFLAGGPDEPLRHHAGFSRREIEFLVRHEKIVRLSDLVLRRTAIALLGELTGELLQELTGIVAQMLGWSPAEADGERRRTAELLRERYGIRSLRPDAA
jgi:glycerol-3-phosphate dehydrogenase